MIARFSDPSETYRRIELDARVEGADGAGLTRVCLEKAIGELSRAGPANRTGNRAVRNEALTKASAAIAALIKGVDQANPLREPLLHLYESAIHAVRGALSDYRQDVIDRVGTDLDDILKIL
ncbi:flagellar protein FliS [Erythrobacter sp. MTPC3]|uniref:flagellar protein FliS n=1 Tax=Erythrobacter sp. MTPC3 TaxID=3056564 RepID=UPI0036F3F15C